MLIKAYGYPLGDEERESPLPLREVTFAGSAEDLRRLATFLVQAADLMEAQGPGFGHKHLQDSCIAFSKDSADVIVCNPS